MTSQLNVDTIVDKAGSGGTNVKIGNTSTYVSDGGSVTQNTVQGLAKSWVNFDGTGTIAARDSLNVGSLTDNGTGDYTVNFSSAFDAADYAPNVSTGITSGSADVRIFSSGIASGSIRIQATNGSQASVQDNNIVTCASHGDLA